MSECTGENCTHESHTYTNQAPKVETKPVYTVVPKKQPLTRNQRKAKRRKGIPGY